MRWIINPAEWVEWHHPGYLFLFVLILLGFFFRKNSYSLPISVSYLRISGRMRTHFRFALPYFLGFLCLSAIILGLVDITRTIISVKEQKSQHRIFVAIDKSSSMWGFGAKHLSIKCVTTARFYPRIWGECRAMFKIIDAVEKRALREKGDAKVEDLVSIILFARDAAVISYPTSDYPVLRKKMENIDWLSGASGRLGINTNIHLAVWGMLRMALERNLRVESGTASFTGKDMRLLQRVLGPKISPDFFPPKELDEKLKALRKELRDTLFIVLTDALTGQMESVMDAEPYSLKKLMQLFSYIGVQTVFISTDEFHLELARLAKRTGFEDGGRSWRGDFIMVRKERDYTNIESLVDRVLAERFGMSVFASVERRVSYTEWFAGAALIFLGIALICKLTMARTLTDS